MVICNSCFILQCYLYIDVFFSMHVSHTVELVMIYWRLLAYFSAALSQSNSQLLFLRNIQALLFLQTVLVTFGCHVFIFYLFKHVIFLVMAIHFYKSWDIFDCPASMLLRLCSSCIRHNLSCGPEKRTQSIQNNLSKCPLAFGSPATFMIIQKREH